MSKSMEKKLIKRIESEDNIHYDRGSKYS